MTGAETGAGTGVFRGNQLVRIDASDSVVDGNTFSGATLVDYSFALRVRGSGTDVTDNVVTGDSPGIQVTVPSGGAAGVYSGNSQIGTAGNDVITSFTPGNDTLSGLDGDDVIAGSGGGDAIDGGSGTDTALYFGARSAYTIGVTTGPDGRVTGFTSVSGAEGTDTLTSIQKLAFNGGAVVIDPTQRVQLFDASNALVGTFATIQAGIDAAGAGYTLRVAAGSYFENLTVNKGVTILGANANVAGTGVRGAETIISDQATVSAGATINGVEVLNTSNNATQFIGVRVTGSADVTVTNTLFFSTGVNGAAEDGAVYLDTSTSGTIAFTNNYVTVRRPASSAGRQAGTGACGPTARMRICRPPVTPSNTCAAR